MYEVCKFTQSSTPNHRSLDPDIDADEIDQDVPLVDLAQRGHATAVLDPGVVLARIQAEGHARVEGEGRVRADERRSQHVATLNRVAARRFHRLRRRGDLATREVADLEIAVGHPADPLAEFSGRAVERVEAFGPAGRHLPIDRRRQ